MDDLTGPTTKALLERFHYCYDGLLRAVEIYYHEAGGSTNARVVISTRDAKAELGVDWCNLHIRITGVGEFRLTESGSRGGYEVLSGGVAIARAGGLYFFEFTQDVDPTDDHVSVDDIRRSEFYIAGRSFSWEIDVYTP